MKIEMDIDSFYKSNGPTLFIDRMAAFLGISTDKMRIVSIVSGSVVIDYEIVMDEDTKKSKVVQEMTASTTSSSSSSGSSTSTSSCGGVSSGIASALSSGVLDLGAKVSDMSYACSQVITDDKTFETTKKETAATSNKSSGGTLISGGV